MANGQALYGAVDPLAPLPDAPPEAPKIGRGQIIAGILADALAGAMGRPGQFAQMMDQQREHDQTVADWGLKRRAALEDYATEQQIQQQYAKPPAPHYFETNNGSVGMIGEDGQPKIVYNDPTPKMNFIPDGLGGGQWVAVPNQAPPAPTQQPAIGLVIPDPRKTGGQTPSASGGFRY